LFIEEVFGRLPRLVPLFVGTRADVVPFAFAIIFSPIV
jgi:hypothetical protein